jgi:hypothetical protein
LNVRVERLDVVRDPAAQATLALLTTKTPPFLYHRESLQIISLEDPESRAKKKEKQRQQRQRTSGNAMGTSSIDGPLIDKVQVRAWAKGRYVSPPGVRWGEIKAEKPSLIDKTNEDENAIDQAELLKDASLTPMQQEGKKSMERRTAEKAAAAAKQ